MKNLKNIAMLIDADNTQLSKLESVIQEISANGRIVVKRAYGNWRKGSLKNWENELKRLAIKAEQQFDYVAGKNATDMALVIDTLDLLHSGIYDAFVIKDSDTPEQQPAPVSSRKAKNRRRSQESAEERRKAKELKEIHKLLHIAWDKYQDDDRYVNVSSAGQYIKRAKPDFDARTYGFLKLPDLIEAYPNKYAMKRYPGKGTVTIIAYKCI